MTMQQQFCLRWNNHQPNFISVFSSLLNNESLVDVTLAAEGQHIQAHKVVLSACSTYFQTLFTINPCQHPIVILKDVNFVDLKVMVDFMYYGEVNVSQQQLPYILQTAEMLKIKGLTEVHMDRSALTTSLNHTELPPGDSNLSTEEALRSSISPALSPLSPSSRRKRLRKTSSGSGSTERTSEEHTASEVTVTSPGGRVMGNLLKPEPGFPECSTPSHGKHYSEESHLQRGSSHDSEVDVPHQITLKVPHQDSLPSVDSVSTPLDMASASSSSSINPQTSTEHKPISSLSSKSLTNPLVMGTKRGRFLMRQPRIKRESDSSQNTDGDHLSQYLSVPPLRVERQCSDPLPTISPSSPPGNLLSVPSTNVLVKQRSQPLLPSEIQQQLQVLHTSPLQIHILPNASHNESEHALSPVVMVSVDSLSETTNASSTTTATLRVRTDELKRSASSPQTGTRPRHCPDVRPGPALGCNYCWNTVDDHGRILRRKTKYHCPECQTNLCIVPCFQEYHQRHFNSGQTDPLALSTVMKTALPKTSSM